MKSISSVLAVAATLIGVPSDIQINTYHFAPTKEAKTNTLQNFWSVAINPNDRGIGMEIGATREEAETKAIEACGKQALTNALGCEVIGTHPTEKGDVVFFTYEFTTENNKPATFGTELTIASNDAMQAELVRDCENQTGRYSGGNMR